MNNLCFPGFILIVFIITLVNCQYNDICDGNNGRRYYLEHGESGSLNATFQNNLWYSQRKNTNISNHRCIVQYTTCPFCVIEVRFRYLNISRNCGRASVYDTCGCDYVWIYEPPMEDASGEEFCGKFVHNNVSELNYVSQTRTVAIAFVYNNEYGHAFSLDYFTKRNRIQLTGYPVFGSMNNVSQIIQSPFFPHLYPVDLSVEYIINCKFIDLCRISILFTDFLIADSSLLEFFDWNGQRMSVITGDKFRPPIIISTGPSLVIRFYANGASNLGFKASYSFILGNLDDSMFKPNIACGGYVNNLGGAITMINMVDQGTAFFNCIWIIKPVENFLHKKTHVYMKVINFSDFAGTTELEVRQGQTSAEPSIELLRYPMTHFSSTKQTEHVVHISKGFYISLRGHFRPESYLAIVFAAFNYKDCFGGSDFLCYNLRCISGFLNCDGFDHCGDNSDESPKCSQDPNNHRHFSKIPNFLFPKVEPYSDVATATLVFLTCTFGLIGVILAMALLLYRVNIRARHQRQIQNHLETIHAILEEGVGGVEEEVFVPDDPPIYEAPPDYDEIVRLKFPQCGDESKLNNKNCSLMVPSDLSVISVQLCDVECVCSFAGTSMSSQTYVRATPNSPPPLYENLRSLREQNNLVAADGIFEIHDIHCESPLPGPSCTLLGGESRNPHETNNSESVDEKSAKYFDHAQKCRSQLLLGEIKKSLRHCRSVNLMKNSRRIVSLSEENLARYFSESELTFASNNKNYWAAYGALKKSFSTADISLL